MHSFVLEILAELVSKECVAMLEECQVGVKYLVATDNLHNIRLIEIFWFRYGYLRYLVFWKSYYVVLRRLHTH